MKLIIIVILVFLYSNYLKSDELIEYYESDEEMEDSYNYDIVTYYENNPIILDYANADELFQLEVFSYSQALEIIELVQLRNIKSISEIEELLFLNELQYEILKRCTKFQYAQKSYNFSILNRSYFQIEDTKGCINNKYKGNSLYNLFRVKSEIRLNDSKISINLIENKDPGESSIVDFYSASVQYHDKDWRIILGDYSLAFGTGSVLSNPFPRRKGIEVINSPNLFYSGIKAYSSSNENFYFSGFSLTRNDNIYGGKSKISLTYSDRDLDANIEDGIAKSILFTGYHRTESENANKSSLKEKLITSAIEYYKDQFEIGLVGYYADYSHKIESENSRLSNGKSSSNINIFSKFNVLDNLSFMADLAMDKNNNILYKFGIIQKREDYQFTINYRRESQNFRSNYSNSFGEYSNSSNEEGIYTGCRISKFENIDISSYFDIFRRLSSSWSSPINNMGYEALLRVSYKIDSVRHFIWRLKYENKSYFDALELEYFRNKMNLRTEYKFKLWSTNLKFRAEYCNLNSIKSINQNGFLLHLSGKKNISESAKINLGINYYNTDSYYTSLYLFESDLKGYLMSLPLFDHGIRLTSTLDYNILDRLLLSLKYSLDFKFDKRTIGSGNDEINKNHRQKIYLQIRYDI